MFLALSLPAIVAISYFLIYFLLIIAATVHGHNHKASKAYTPFKRASVAEAVSCCGPTTHTRKYLNSSQTQQTQLKSEMQILGVYEFEKKISFLSALWTSRAMYGQVLVHLYDTATDAGVLTQWFLLMRLEQEHHARLEMLDLETLFLTSVAFIALYRALSVFIALRSAYRYEAKQTCFGMLFDATLGVLDLYLLKAVYKTVRDDETEPSATQKVLQFGESILESLPQVALQTVFIVRSQDDPLLEEQEMATYLVVLSLIASAFSIANKCAWMVELCCVE